MRITSSLLSFSEWWYNCVYDSLICGVGGALSCPWGRFGAMDAHGRPARAGTECCLIYGKPAMGLLASSKSLFCGK